MGVCTKNSRTFVRLTVFRSVNTVQIDVTGLKLRLRLIETIQNHENIIITCV